MTATLTSDGFRVAHNCAQRANPGNLLDLYVPDVEGNAKLTLIIWHSGSTWFSNNAKNSTGGIPEELNPRG